MSNFRKGIWIWLGLLAAIGLALAPAPVAMAAGLTPVEPTVKAGETATFVGTDFQANEMVTWWVTTPRGVVISDDDYDAQADNSGRVVARYSLPDNAEDGAWALTAYGRSSEMAASAPFTVVGGEGTPEPLAAVSPPVGPPGATFSFFGADFNDDEPISYWFTGPDGAVAAAFPAEKNATDDGRVDFSWTSPVDAQSGQWVVTIQGVDSGRARAVPFMIQ